MNILLISQCDKKALVETRRIIDQFAERKGDRTWQTAITYEGLKTLRKMLRKTARRNTAVACHWLKNGHNTELLWLIGNQRRFNRTGAVPTSITRQDILRSKDENQWHHATSISLLSALAGLFHDFGKANYLFQEKLRHSNGPRAEPVRHEWVSLRLFEAFVKGKTDREWLQALTEIGEQAESEILTSLIRDTERKSPNPFASLQGQPIAETVGWLIVSHHRLPIFPVKQARARKEREPRCSNIDTWRTDKGNFRAHWNSAQYLRDDWQTSDWEQVWAFEKRTPIASLTWRKKAQSIAARALRHSGLFERVWMEDRFSLHLSRLSLMLADHYYSSLPPESSPAAWRDDSYKAYANTHRPTGALKQQLDEHNIGVAHNAFLLANGLPRLRDTLPVFTNVRPLKKRTTVAQFRWQDKAYDLACSLKERSQAQGFFGINMASTGKGKTFANARIMYGLSDEQRGCRFSVALGLRTLTLQTGDALAEKLKLDSDDLAVLIGSQAVRQLHDRQRDQREAEVSAVPGSDSGEPLYAEHFYVRYDGGMVDGRLRQWLEQSPTALKLLSAPVLVSTIDHLIPATEGQRGGKQIAPMLRLLTSDLVLDEPDDFGLEDLPALCRLVNWAGMLGSRVLLSSATLPPSLLGALFDAYRAGRVHYNAAVGEPDQPSNICCAWFDEFGVAQTDAAKSSEFATAHDAFVARRITALEKQESPLRRAALMPAPPAEPKVETLIAGLAEAVATQAIALHDDHKVTSKDHSLSLGLIRMANINPLVAVARALFAATVPADYRLHICVYHSQHPLLVRSNMEATLDRCLTRHDESAIWAQPEVQAAIKQHPERNHLFIVLASPVAEVGRDHDYDWAIAEPSSMRSLIQLAGRIQRHRQQSPRQPNLRIWQKNLKGMRGVSPAFSRPGFEDENFGLSDNDLSAVLEESQYQSISAIPRIQPREQLAPTRNLVDLEHAHLQERLFGNAGDVLWHASLWWKSHADWCFEVQRHTPFRRSAPSETFILYGDEDDEALEFYALLDNGEVKKMELSRFERVTNLEAQLSERVSPWLTNDTKALAEALAEELDMPMTKCCEKFCQLQLRASEEPTHWQYHPWLGVFSKLR